jgi:hypothetical protein
MSNSNPSTSSPFDKQLDAIRKEKFTWLPWAGGNYVNLPSPDIQASQPHRRADRPITNRPSIIY